MSDANFPEAISDGTPPPTSFQLLSLRIQEVELLELIGTPHRRRRWMAQDGWIAAVRCLGKNAPSGVEVGSDPAILGHPASPSVWCSDQFEKLHFLNAQAQELKGGRRRRPIADRLRKVGV